MFISGSNFCKVVDNQSSSTLIVFSSAGIPEGKFSGSKLFSKFDANIIYLNAPSNNWFIGNIPNVGRDVKEIAKYLNHLVNALGTTTLFTYGGSMGGYGAILYGSLLNADRVFSTGVESTLGVKGGFFNLHCKVVSSKLDLKYSCLKKIIKDESNKTLCLYGEFSHVDMNSANELRDICNVKTIKNEDHSLPPLLHFHYDYLNIIKSYYEKGEVNELNGLYGTLLDSYALSNYIYEMRYLNIDNVTKIQRYIVEPSIDGINKSYGLFHLGVTAKKLGKQKEAFEYLNQSVAYNGGNFVALYSLSDMANSIGKIDLAEHYAKRALSFVIPGFRPLYNANFSLINAFLSKKDFSLAQEELKILEAKLTSGARENPHIKARLAKTKKILANKIRY